MEKQINISVEDNNKLWKLIENYRKVEECMKEELANMLRLTGIIIDDLERSRMQESKSADRYR